MKKQNTSGHKPSINYGIQANNVSADIIAVGQGAKASKQIIEDGSPTNSEIESMVNNLTALLSSHVTTQQQDHILELLSIIKAAISGPPDAEGKHRTITSDSNIAHLISSLSGRRFADNNHAISFGDDSQVGDISISDVAGRDIYKFTIYFNTTD